MKKRIDIIAIPSDLGNYHSGARFGPSAFLRSGVLSVLEKNGFEPRFIALDTEVGDESIFDSPRPSRAKIEHKKKIFAIGGFAARAVHRAHNSDNLPVVVGGDNSFSEFTIGQTLRNEIREGHTTGLLWVDAHLDSHTEKTSPSHHAHGMPLAGLLGQGNMRDKIPVSVRVTGKNGKAVSKKILPYVLPENVIHIGAGEEDVEPEEIGLLNRLGVQVFDLKRLRGNNGWNDLFAAYEQLLRRVDSVVIMVDMDVFHQTIAPGVFYRSKNGLTDAEWPALFDNIRLGGKLIHIELMEMSPEHDEKIEGGTKTTALATKVLMRMLKR